MTAMTIAQVFAVVVFLLVLVLLVREDILRRRIRALLREQAARYEETRR